MDYVTKISSGLGISNYVLLVLTSLVIVMIVMMLLQVKISLSWLIPAKYSILAASTKFWVPSGIYTNLTVPSSKAPYLSDTSYTCMFEGLLFNSRNYKSTDGPYRQLAHRGSNELAPTTSLSPVGCSANGMSANLPPFGLPKRLNPGIFLDPNTNDILIFVDSSNGQNVYRDSVRIADIPLDIPFTLIVVLNGRVLEVYLNCGLEVTKFLSGDARTVENEWYGLCGSASANAQIQNLSIWNYPLTSSDIRSFCSKAPPKFQKLRPQCNGTDITNLPTTSASTTTATSDDSSLQQNLNTCS